MATSILNITICRYYYEEYKYKCYFIAKVKMKVFSLCENRLKTVEGQIVAFCHSDILRLEGFSFVLRVTTILC
jgi:hypothetical protein